MDPKSLQLLSLLAAAGQKNPTNAAIFNAVLNTVGGTFENQVGEEQRQRQQKFNDTVAQNELNKYFETGDSNYLEKANRIMKGGNIKNILGEQTTNERNYRDIPDEFREQELANAYADELKKAQQSGDYSQVEKLKTDFADYKFDMDPTSGSVNVSLNKPRKTLEQNIKDEGLSGGNVQEGLFRLFAPYGAVQTTKDSLQKAKSFINR